MELSDCRVTQKSVNRKKSMQTDSVIWLLAQLVLLKLPAGSEYTTFPDDASDQSVKL
jgi:hypothetical protein